MKKKELDKIEPVKVKKASRKYMAVIGAKKVEINEEPHLIVDFFENKKESFKKPFLRIVINKNEYANRMEDGTWNTKNIRTRNYDDIWNWGRQQVIREQEIFIGEEHFDTIKYFEQYMCKTAYNRSWKCSISGMQYHIYYNKKQNEDKKKDELMKARMTRIEEPPEEFKIWARHQMTSVYMYYKRKGNKVELVCSECGKEYTRRISTGMFEEEVMNCIKPPIPNCYSRCIKCDAIGIYKQAGRNKGVEGFARNVYMIEPYEGDVAVVRYFTVNKYLQQHRKSDYSIIEKGRLFIGKNVNQAYWCWYDKKWSRYNPGGYANTTRAEKGKLWPGSSTEETFLKYSQIKEYADNGKKQFSAWDFAKVYKVLPELEMVIKSGMSELAEELITRGPHILEDGDNFIEMLGIDKRCLKDLVEVKGNWEYLRMMQLEKAMGLILDNDTRSKIVPYRIQFSKAELRLALQYMTFNKFIRQVEKYAECKFTGYECMDKMNSLRNTITTYLDYLTMRDELHHDLNNTVRLYPRILRTEHDILVREKDAKKQETYIAEKERKFSNIPLLFEKLCEKYSIEFEGMCIRPARSAGEIITEGRLQHHCVGGENYLRKHNEGETAILFLRHIETPDEPYITIEVRDNAIVQWYGIYDSKPDKGMNDAWLEKYVKYLKTGKKPKETKIQVTVKRLMVAAV